MQFQVVSCKSATTGGANWNYGAASYYRMAEGAAEGYIVLPSGGNGTVKTAGTYTFTVDNSGETPVFVITPAEGLEPDTSVQVLHYYIKGSMHPNWNTPMTEQYELKADADNEGVYTMEIHLNANIEFMFYGMNEDAEGNFTTAPAEIKGNKLEEGITCVTGSGNMTTVAAGTYTFTYNSNTEKLNVTFVADQTEETPAAE